MRGVLRRLGVGGALLVVVIVALGVALLATAWSTHARVDTAADVLARGQGAALYERVAAALAGGSGEPTPAALAVVLGELEEDGLRYVAVAGARGRVLAAAGAPAGRDDGLDAAPGGEPRVVGGRLRVVYRGPPRRRGAELARRAPLVVLEFDDLVAAGLRGASRQALWLGLAALGCLAAAGLLARWLLRRDAAARAADHARRLASLGEMSATMAHELRNPLASLKGNAQLLARMLPEDERPRAKAERVVGEAERLEALTNDLLEFARTGELVRAEVEPAALVREAAAAVDEAGVRVEVDAAAAPARWRLDPARLRQVLVNLIGNATQAGDGPVRVEVAADAGQLTIRVRDHGPGIAPADLPRLFEPFFTRRTTGTGLGLAVARRLVELHGGTLVAANADGGGALFTVRLPP